MSRIIYCLKLKKEALGLDAAPFPGELGQKIYEHVSEEAWNGWITQQTMLINEHRLNLADAAARTFLKQHMRAFFEGCF